MGTMGRVTPPPVATPANHHMLSCGAVGVAVFTANVVWLVWLGAALLFIAEDGGVER